MRHPNTTVLVIFPGALGDFLCFLPTLQVLHERHLSVSLVTHPSFLEFIDLPRLRGISIERRIIAELFGEGAPSAETRDVLRGHGHVFTWSGGNDADFARKLRAVTAGEVQQFPFRGMQSGEHATDYYARCVNAVAPPVDRRILRLDSAWLERFCRDNRLERSGYVAVHPGSGSRAKNWSGFADLIGLWRQRRDDPVVVIRGPVEIERDPVLPHALSAEPSTLAQLASLLSAARRYVGNDSGVSHLAAALGVRGVCLFGPSEASTWAPRGGSLRILSAEESCTKCGAEIFCTHRLPVESVFAALAG